MGIAVLGGLRSRSELSAGTIPLAYRASVSRAETGSPKKKTYQYNVVYGLNWP